MDRFSSSKLRIAWTISCLLLSILVFIGVKQIGAHGDQLTIFGVGLPLGFEDIEPYVVQNLSRAVYTVVPAVMLLGGFIQLGEWIIDSNYLERYRGLLFGSVLAIGHGALFAQITILPFLVAGYKLLGNSFIAPIILADINAILLGSQLLLWSLVFGLIIKSNRGLTIFLVYLLNEIGNVMDWCSEFLIDLNISETTVKIASIFSRSLPGSKLPSDKISFINLLLSLSVPIALAAILVLVPYSKGTKRSRT